MSKTSSRSSLRPKANLWGVSFDFTSTCVLLFSALLAPLVYAAVKLDPASCFVVVIVVSLEVKDP